MVSPVLFTLASSMLGNPVLPESGEDFTAENYFDRGVALDQQGNIEEAVEAYEKALQLDPDHLPSLNNQAVLLIRTGHRKRAMKLYRRAIRIDETSTEARYNLAEIYLEDELTFQATVLLEQILRHDPEDLNVRLKLARVYASVGNEATAKKHLEASVHFSESQLDEYRHLRAQVYFELADRLRSSGKWDSLTGYLEIALLEDPNHKDALMMATEMALAQKRYDEARQLFIRVLNLEPAVKPGVNEILESLPFPAATAIFVPVCYEEGLSRFAAQLLDASVNQAKAMGRADWIARMEDMRKDF